CQPAAHHFGDDADDLPRLLGGELAHERLADREPFRQRIRAVLQVLAHERLVDDDYRRRLAVVAVVEGAPALHWNPEHFEVAAGDGQPPSAAVRRRVLQRLAGDDERQTVAALERDAAGGAVGIAAQDTA